MAWYNSSWGRRHKITIQSSKVDDDFTDFPILLNEDNFLTSVFDNCETDGSDLVFTSSDGTTKLSRELVSIDTGATDSIEVWVKIPSISSSSDTDIYVYYDNSGASETNDTSTWNSDFFTVLHMKEDPSGSAPQMIDSTSNNKDFTSVNMESGDLVSAKIGNALDFDGSNEYLTDADFANPTDVLSFSAWVYLDQTSHNNDTRSICETSGTNSWYGLSLSVTSNNKLGGWVRGTSSNVLLEDSANFPLQTWTHIAMTKDATNHVFKVYVDGVVVDSSTNTDLVVPGCTALEIATYRDKNGRFWPGIIDELRVTSNALTSEWINTEINNQDSPSTFAIEGSEELPETIVYSDRDVYVDILGQGMDFQDISVNAAVTGVSDNDVSVSVDHQFIFYLTCSVPLFDTATFDNAVFDHTGCFASLPTSVDVHPLKVEDVNLSVNVEVTGFDDESISVLVEHLLVDSESVSVNVDPSPRLVVNGTEYTRNLIDYVTESEINGIPSANINTRGVNASNTDFTNGNTIYIYRSAEKIFDGEIRGLTKGTLRLTKIKASGHIIKLRDRKYYNSVTGTYSKKYSNASSTTIITDLLSAQSDIDVGTIATYGSNYDFTTQSDDLLKSINKNARLTGYEFEVVEK